MSSRPKRALDKSHCVARGNSKRATLTGHRKPASAPRVSDTSAKIFSTLSSVFGLTAFRGAQEDIIRHVIEGGSCMVLMPTGGGKSLCYQLPALLREGCGIVVSR